MGKQEMLAAAIQRVTTGNAGHAPEGFVRDLSLRKPEFWETRPYPKVLFHWTEHEFTAFLAEHRFPPNTLRDREQCRLLTIRDALARGLFIPPEVMADGATAQAVADALILVKADFAFQAADLSQKHGQLAFDTAIGYLSADGGYHARMADLLARACRADGRKPIGTGVVAILSDIKEVELDGLPFRLTLSLRTPEQPNRNHGRDLWLEIRDASYNDVSYYGDVRRVSFASAESIFRGLMDTKVVTLAEARTLMGSQWQPYLRVTASMPVTQ